MGPWTLPQPSTESVLSNPKKFYSSILLVFLVIILGGGIAAFFMMTAKTTEPKEKVKAVKIVQTIDVSGTKESIHVSADGIVIPTRQVTIKPEVRGRVLVHHPELVVGGHIGSGEELVSLDRSDYELALNEHQAALEEAKFAIAVEAGRQVVAKREFGLLEKDLKADDVNQGLVLRKPHLERAEAVLAMAQNEIAKAELDLARTVIQAPFNAVVIEEAIETGQLVDSGDSICTLAGTDAFWVQVTIPFEELKWIKLPKPNELGSKVKVTLDQGDGVQATWDGVVERLLGDLDPRTRMARILIQVEDPLGLQPSSGGTRFPLLLGSFVSVDIDVGTLEDVITIPREALHDDKLWLVDSANELQIRTTEVLWKRDETLLVKNVLQEGEQVIVSDLRAALPGLKVSPQPLATTPEKKP